MDYVLYVFCVVCVMFCVLCVCVCVFCLFRFFWVGVFSFFFFFSLSPLFSGVSGYTVWIWRLGYWMDLDWKLYTLG